MRLAMSRLVCYNIRMSTTQNNTAETSRPCCCVCGADHVDDVRADMAWDAHERAMGYEGDDDPYWEQHAEG